MLFTLLLGLCFFVAGPANAYLKKFAFGASSVSDYYGRMWVELMKALPIDSIGRVPCVKSLYSEASEHHYDLPGTGM